MLHLSYSYTKYLEKALQGTHLSTRLVFVHYSRFPAQCMYYSCYSYIPMASLNNNKLFILNYFSIFSTPP